MAEGILEGCETSYSGRCKGPAIGYVITAGGGTNSQRFETIWRQATTTAGGGDVNFECDERMTRGGRRKSSFSKHDQCMAPKHKDVHDSVLKVKNRFATDVPGTKRRNYLKRNVKKSFSAKSCEKFSKGHFWKDVCLMSVLFHTRLSVIFMVLVPEALSLMEHQTSLLERRLPHKCKLTF